jgi:DivIVA domain-containing protein
MTHANSEPLTPERVRSAVFRSARLGRRGLDEAQVRAFCGWVSDELARLLNENTMLQGDVRRLRERVLEGRGKSGVQPEDAHVQAVYVLSKAQQTADRYVADAQEYSRELAEEAHLRRDEILREAQVRASIILEEAHSTATRAASEVSTDNRESLPASERQELQAEIAYLRTFSDVCRTHLRAYLESLTRSIEEWDRAEHAGALTARASVSRTAQQVLYRISRPGRRREPRSRCHRSGAWLEVVHAIAHTTIHHLNAVGQPWAGQERCPFSPAAGGRPGTCPFNGKAGKPR